MRHSGRQRTQRRLVGAAWRSGAGPTGRRPRGQAAAIWGHRPVAAAGLVAAALAIAFLLAPPLGTDLSAQVARADFVREYGRSPVDLRWYGGTVQYGYSLVAPAVMAVLGARLTGALAATVSAVALAALFVRTGARRPLLGGVLGAVCCAGNLVSGRVTFALGVALGLLALLALTADRRWLRIAGTTACALLAAATSPVAGLFLGLAGVALAIAGRWRSGILLVGGAAVPLVVMAVLFGEGGWMNISRADAVHATVTSLVVALTVSRPVVRAGAALSALGVVTAFAVHTPVGLNATRLATMFALPVVAAYAEPPRWRPSWPLPVLGAAALVALALWQPPVLVDDLRDAGNSTASRSYAAPLLAELARRAPVGRIEVPPTRDYWESAHVARAVLLARGWLRQLDLRHNALFFDGTLTAASYEAWLRDNGVSYVALPDAELSWVGRAEGALVQGGLPYLTEVWRGGHWVLYEVAGRPSILAGAVLVGATGAQVTFDVTVPGDVLVRVRWSRWLRARGATVRPSAGGWTMVYAPYPGRYVVTSGIG
jgi:hypothetical protein